MGASYTVIQGVANLSALGIINDERWGGGDDGVAALTSYGAEHPQKGVIVHVPHVAVGGGIFNSSLASFLLGANDGDGCKDAPLPAPRGSYSP